MDIISQFKLSLVNVIDIDEIPKVVDVIAVVLNDYDIVEKSKELIPYINYNDEVIKDYAVICAIEGKAKSTIKAYIRALNRLIKYANKNLNEITTKDIQAYLGCKRISGVSKTAVNNDKNYISSFYNWCVNEGIISVNPCDKINSIKCDKIIKPPFTDTDIYKMRTCDMPIRSRAMFELLLTSGVRVSELCNLDISDVDLDKRKVTVRLGKGGKDRIVYISDNAAFVIGEYLKTRDDNLDALFLTRPDRNIDNRMRLTKASVYEVFKYLRDNTGVTNIHAHRFRYTFATNLYRKGMSVEEIQRLLGHSNISTTLRYITINDSSVESSYRQKIN